MPEPVRDEAVLLSEVRDELAETMLELEREPRTPFWNAFFDRLLQGSDTLPSWPFDDHEMPRLVAPAPQEDTGVRGLPAFEALCDEAEALGERLHQQYDDDYPAYTSIMDTITEARAEVEAAASALPSGGGERDGLTDEQWRAVSSAAVMSLGRLSPDELRDVARRAAPASSSEEGERIDLLAKRTAAPPSTGEAGGEGLDSHELVCRLRLRLPLGKNGAAPLTLGIGGQQPGPRLGYFSGGVQQPGPDGDVELWISLDALALVPLLAATPPAGETGDGRELREWTLSCVGEEGEIAVAEGPEMTTFEEIRVREIPSKETTEEVRSDGD